MILPPCTLQTCSLKLYGLIQYQPNIPANVLFLAICSLLLISQIILGLHYRSGLVAFGMLMCLACEVAGYTARLFQHENPFLRSYYIWSLITSTLGPAFLAGAI